MPPVAAHIRPVHHYKAKNPGCRSHRCDMRVWRWWARHHARQSIGQPQGPEVVGVASWYSDEGSTACGTHYAAGVASLTLACGTRLELCHDGCEVVVVQDRGPYIAGRVLDLNPGAKAGIACDDLCSVRYSLLPNVPRRPTP
jgi:rare lipoprotein A (peptidoglycan hydrolase)